MSFEEFIKSDDGKKRIAQALKSNKRLFIVSISFFVLIVLAALFVLPFEFLDEEFVEANKTLHILQIVAICVSALILALAFIFAIFAQKQLDRSDRLLAKAVRLFWLESPVNWEPFVQNGELLLTVEKVYPEGYHSPKKGKLSSLVVKGGEGEVTLDLSLWQGVMDGCVGAFLLSSLIPFFNHRQEHGMSLATVRIAETIKQKPINGKKEGYIFKNGKLTKEGKPAFRRANMMSSTFFD